MNMIDGLNLLTDNEEYSSKMGSAVTCKFKRDFYEQVLNTLDNKDVVFLLGPRKCGKTVMLRQFESENSDVRYVDFKAMESSDAKIDLVTEVVKSVLGSKKCYYLLDEVTYMFFPDSEIARIAGAYTQAKALGIKIQTKVIFAGSQSVALEAWGYTAFSTQAAYIRVSFLTYAEWLRYLGLSDINEDTYLRFLFNVSEFYGFSSLEDYLKGCLNETVNSNANSQNYIFGNDCDLIDECLLSDILYLILFSLHDHVSAINFFKQNALTDKVSYVARQLKLSNPLSRQDIAEMIAKSWLRRYDNVRSVDLATLKQALLFLIRCDLIVATPVISDLDTRINVKYKLERDTGFKTKREVFSQVNYTIKYPMFYVAVLKEILKSNLTMKLESITLGSIVECHVRGLLPCADCFEYRDFENREIDYIDRRNGLAVEIATWNKKDSDVNFDILAECGYDKILLTKDIRESSDIVRIPYYEYIYNLSSSCIEH